MDQLVAYLLAVVALIPAPTGATAVDLAEPPQRILPVPTRAPGAHERRDLAAAVRRASARRRTFATDGEVRIAGIAAPARARLSGQRRADGSSTARLDWRGAAALLLPSGDLRIVGNELSIRRDDRPRAGFVDQGSASGIALDVGRELLAHPFLLDLTGAARAGSTRTWRLVARPSDLRRYAGTERRGLATELLLGARSLTIDARERDGELDADAFRLVTVLPSRFGVLAGRRVVVTGRTIAR